MNRVGMCKLKFNSTPYSGSVVELVDREKFDYIIPESVRLVLYGHRIKPLQFDGRGNPQFGGVVKLMMMWLIWLKVCDGTIGSISDAEIMYSYETSDGKPIEIPFEKRIRPVDICPICGERVVPFENRGVVICAGTFTAPNDTSVEVINECAHKKCALKFYRMKTIFGVTKAFDYAFNHPKSSEEKRFRWGKTDKDMRMKYVFNVSFSMLPWFMFYTPLGDVKIGWRGELIEITFMDNFATFDMAVFAKENVAKHFGKNGARSIYADNFDKMSEYLVMARDAILPLELRLKSQ